MYCHGALGGEGTGDQFVTIVKYAGRLVQQLQDPDHSVLAVLQRNVEQAVRPVAGCLVDGALEPGVGIGIGDVDDVTVLEALAHQTLTRLDPG